MTDKDRPLEWIASSNKELMALPPDVRRRFGDALSLAQMGDQEDAAKTSAKEPRNAKRNH